MSEYKMRRECGCVVSWQPDMPEATWFRHCPVHEAAPDLLEASEAILADLKEYGFLMGATVERLHDTVAPIRKAKGEGDEQQTPAQS